MRKFLSILATVLLRALEKFIRFERVGFEHEKKAREDRTGKVIYAMWHNRILFTPYCYNYCSDSKEVFAMVSNSKDGEVIAGILERRGLKVIRGSTKKGGREAFVKLLRKTNQSDVCVVPDGPNGPRYKVQPGVISLAQKTGLPILPFCYNVTKKKVLGSWDGFFVPYPFTKGVIGYGEPMWVSPDADEKVLEEKRVELENRLNELTEKFDGYFD